MKALERKDSLFKEMVNALLQIMRMLNEEELSGVLATKLKIFLDDFLTNAVFLSFIKRNYNFNFTHRSNDPGTVIDVICGKKHSKEISGADFHSRDNDIYAYQRIEEFRDRCKWKKILFKNLKDCNEKDCYPGSTSIVIMNNVNIIVFKTGKEMREFFFEGYARPFHFFRLYDVDNVLIIHYAEMPYIDLKETFCVADVKLAYF